MFGIPESQIGCLGDVDGLDVVELGCGAAYFSAWLARRGARPVGVDPTPAQLETARRMQAETGIEFPLVEAPGEACRCRTASFDLALSEYGASLWADPARVDPGGGAAASARRAARLPARTRRSSILCVPDSRQRRASSLLRPQFGMYRFDVAGRRRGIEYHLAARRLDRAAARERVRDRGAARAAAAPATR